MLADTDMAHTLLVITVGLTLTPGVCGRTKPDQSNKGLASPGGQRICLDGYNMTWSVSDTDTVTYCLKLYTVELNRTAAERRCHQDYTELIRLDILNPSFINLSKAFDKIMMARLKGRRVWVGMKKQGGRLVWDGLSPSLATSNSNGGLIQWKDGHPSLSGECVKGMLNVKPSPHVELMTASCKESLPFICYRRSDQVKLTKGEPLCPKGWDGNELIRKCYYNPMLGNVWVRMGSFDYAVKLCKNKQGNVAMQTGNFSISVIKEVALPDHTVWLPRPVNETFFSPAYGKGKENCVKIVKEEEQKRWKRVPCIGWNKFLCEKDAETPDPVRLINVSSNYTEIDDTNIQDHVLVCEATNYYPEAPIVWYKDGLPLPLPPDARGFRLNLADVKQNESHISFVQGTYICTVNGRNLLSQVTSDPMVVRITGLFTLLGRMHLPCITEDDMKIHVRDWLLQGRGSSGEFYEIVHSLVAIAPRNTFGAYIHNITWPGKGDPLLQGVVVEFNVNYLENDIITVLHNYTSRKQIDTSLLADMYSQKVLLHSLLVENIEAAHSKRKLFKQCKVHAKELELFNAEFCFERSIENKMFGVLTFPSTAVGQVGQTILHCPGTGTPYGSAKCITSNEKVARWDRVEWISECPIQLKDLTERNVSKENAAHVAGFLENLTSSAESMTSEDIALTSLVLEKVARVSNVDKAAVNASIRTVNNLMMVGRQKLRETQRTKGAASRIVKALETIVNHVELTDAESWTVVQPLIAVEARKLTQSTSFTGFGTTGVNGSFKDDNIKSFQNESEVDFRAVDTVILLPLQNIQKHLTKGRMTPPNDSIRLSYTVYSNTKLFVTMGNHNHTEDVAMHAKLASHVIGGSVGGLPVYNLSEPVSIVFRPFHNASGYRCVFWDFTMNNDFGGWSGKGCHFHKRQKGSIICRCDHLTNFAILFDRNPTKAISTALHVLSIVGLSLSLLGLLMTILTFLIFKQFRKGRGFQILFQLAVALFCTNVLVLAGLERTDLLAVCSAVAALLLYFLLAAFCWMVVEAIHQYLLFVKVYGSEVSGFMRKAALFAWGIPAVIVGVVAAVDYRLLHGPENYCWISQTALYYAFMLPVGLVLVINTVLFSMVLREFFCGRGQKDKGGTHDDTSRQVIVAVSCFLVIGLTWVFGFFAIDDAREPFLYLFCIFNSIQGFLIFIFYIVRVRQIRAAWVAFICCGRVDVTGDKSTTTGTKTRYTKTSEIESAGGHGEHSK